MRRIAGAALAATLAMCVGVAVAQIASDMPDDPTSTGVPATRSTPVKPAASHSMFDDASLFDSIARYPLSSDPMSTGLLSKDIHSKMSIDGSGESTEQKGQ
jgi:hypothetical protein